MNYGYIRVSTGKQTVENQRFEILRFAQQHGLSIDGWMEETISGTKNYDKRKLGQLLKDVEAGDLIVCAELSRLGRSLFMIMEILSVCMSKECRVWTIKDGYRLGDDIQSKVLAFAFGLSAEIERDLISQRTKEALARKKQRVSIWAAPRDPCPNPSSSPAKRTLSVCSGQREPPGRRSPGCSMWTAPHWSVSQSPVWILRKTEEYPATVFRHRKKCGRIPYLYLHI